MAAEAGNRQPSLARDGSSICRRPDTCPGGGRLPRGPLDRVRRSRGPRSRQRTVCHARDPHRRRTDRQGPPDPRVFWEAPSPKQRHCPAPVRSSSRTSMPTTSTETSSPGQASPWEAPRADRVHAQHQTSARFPRSRRDVESARPEQLRQFVRSQRSHRLRPHPRRQVDHCLGPTPAQRSGDSVEAATGRSRRGCVRPARWRDRDPSRARP
jgi:hypothetical protein